MSGTFHHRDPAGMCGCHGDDFMGRRPLSEIKFLKRTLRWHDYVEELAKLLGHTGHRSVTKTRFLGT